MNDDATLGLEISKRMYYFALLFVSTIALLGCEDTALPLTQQVEAPSLTLNLYCLGEGSPTVVLLPGLSGKSSSWKQVIGGIHENSEVCAVDFITNGEPETGGQSGRYCAC
jgi:hypothetical protein